MQGILVSTRNRSQMCLCLSAAVEAEPSPCCTLWAQPHLDRDICAGHCPAPAQPQLETFLGGWVGMSPSSRDHPRVCLQQGSSKQPGWRAIHLVWTWQLPRWRLFLAPSFPMQFPGPFVSCLIAWGSHRAISEKHTAAFGDGDPMGSAQDRAHGWQIRKPFLCWKRWDGAWEMEMEKGEMEKGLHLDQRSGTSWGEITGSYPGKLMAKGLLCASYQLTGGTAIPLDCLALWYKEWLYKSR